MSFIDEAVQHISDGMARLREADAEQHRHRTRVQRDIHELIEKIRLFLYKQEMTPDVAKALQRLTAVDARVEELAV